jgi:hypothetical protein
MTSDGAPGIPLEDARVITLAHVAEHQRHREVIERLDKIEARLAEIAALLEPQAGQARRSSTSAPRSSRGK